jgi:hypothetical protein
MTVEVVMKPNDGVLQVPAMIVEQKPPAMSPLHYWSKLRPSVMVMSEAD